MPKPTLGSRGHKGNILLLPNDPEDKTDKNAASVSLCAIDYEYSQYNYRGFDIGNHFCEWCYNYQITDPPYFKAKLNDYPNREQQLQFIRAYLAEDSEANESDRNGHSEVTDEEEAMLLEVNMYALASHFLWGLWGIVQDHISSIEFDYLEYSLARFNAYFEQKKQLLASHKLTNGNSIGDGF